MRKIFQLIGFVLFGLNVQAQDPHFSQFFASPLTLNPAFTGKFDGVWRIAANNKNQWLIQDQFGSTGYAFSTSSFSLDFPILKNKIPEGDVFGVGISALKDASANNTLKLNYGSASLSYHKALDESGYNTIGAGFQGTYSNLLLDTRQLHFEDELTGNGWYFDPQHQNPTTGSSADYNTGLFKNKDNIRNYFDMNAGILYSGSSNGENNYYLGLSMYHINRPKLSYQKNNAWFLSNRTTIHGGGSFSISDVVGLNVSFIQQFQNKANETVLGGTLSINANGDDEKPTNVYVGSWMRVNDAIIPYLGLEVGGLRIGATYDINISGVKSALSTKLGSEMEFSIIYIKRPPESKGIPCPRF
jgi:type IX secretion system PorP/SprF family membrane protein